MTNEDYYDRDDADDDDGEDDNDTKIDHEDRVIYIGWSTSIGGTDENNAISAIVH